MAERYELVLAKHIDNDCTRLYRTNDYEVEAGDVLLVESDAMGKRYAVAVSVRNFVSDEEIAFWCDVCGIGNLKKVLAKAGMKNIGYEGDEDETV